MFLFRTAAGNRAHLTIRLDSLVKTREIMMHERFSFLKRDEKLESIRVRYLSIRLDSHGVVPVKVRIYCRFEAIRRESPLQSRIFSPEVDSR